MICELDFLLGSSARSRPTIPGPLLGSGPAQVALSHVGSRARGTPDPGKDPLTQKTIPGRNSSEFIHSVHSLFLPGTLPEAGGVH